MAALRLMTKSNLVGCSTGSSAGLAPFPDAVVAYLWTGRRVAHLHARRDLETRKWALEPSSAMSTWTTEPASKRNSPAHRCALCHRSLRLISSSVLPPPMKVICPLIGNEVRKRSNPPKKRATTARTSKLLLTVGRVPEAGGLYPWGESQFEVSRCRSRSRPIRQRRDDSRRRRTSPPRRKSGASCSSCSGIGGLPDVAPPL